jgi:hypothetical protein
MKKTKKIFIFLVVMAILDVSFSQYDKGCKE